MIREDPRVDIVPLTEKRSSPGTFDNSVFEKGRASEP